MWVCFKICDREILGKFVEFPVPERWNWERERSVKCKTVQKWKRGHAGRERLEGSAKVARLSLSVLLPLTSLSAQFLFHFIISAFLLNIEKKAYVYII